MTRAVRVGLLGHWGGNVGHEIMALGVETVLQWAFGERLECVRIEQHRPFDIYSFWHPLRHLPFLRHGRNGGLTRAVKKFLNRRDVSASLWSATWVGDLDLGVACGGPLITPHMASGDLGLMFHHMYGAFASRVVPVVNLSVGSCYPLEQQVDDLDSENMQFLKGIFEYAAVTTVRDNLAQRLCARAGEACELVLDTGFVAGEAFARMVPTLSERRYVLINYQKSGGNEDWGQHVDTVAWENTMRNLVASLRRRYEVVFVCHNDMEFRLAHQIDETAPRFQPKTSDEYARLVCGAIAGISNRIHAAVALASVGSPVIGVGTDSRLGTLQAIGLPCFFVKQVTTELLEETLEKLIRTRRMEGDRLMVEREKAMIRYREIVLGTLASKV